MAEVTEVTEDDSSFISDHSFVILGQGSLNLDINDGDIQNANSQRYSLTNGEHQEFGSTYADAEADANSTLAGASSIGIQLKLEKLVKENLLLKETLNQSNLAMKNQFDTLALWHDEVVKTHESHKQKFQETQDQIFKLRNENVNLKKLIQQNLETCCGNNSALVSMELEGVTSPLDVGAGKNSKEDFHYMYIEELKMKNTNLEKMVNDIKQEKVHLEKELEKVLEENNNLKKKAESETGLCVQCQGSKNLTTGGGSNEQQEKGKSSEEMSLDPEISIINKLSKSVEAELVLSASKQEFAELKKQFEEQSEISMKNSEKLEKMMAMYDEIVAENEKLKNELEQSKLKTEELNGKIASLNEELKAKDEQLKVKVDEFEQVTKEMKKLMLDCEEVAILRTQVELYKDDFNEERKARELAVGEKEKMAEQVRFLERTLSDFRKREKDDNASVAASAPPEDKIPFSYKCPKCMKQLPTLTECESHVEACLELDLFP